VAFAYPPPGSYLLPTERRVLRTRRHWAKLAPRTLLTMVLVPVLIGLAHLVSGHGLAAVTTILWYGAVAAVIRLAIIIADWWDDLIMITDGRIVSVTGLLASRGRDTPINKITDRDIQHSVMGNILGYGTLKVESAGIESLQRLDYVPRIMTVYEAILKLTSEDGLPSPSVGEQQFEDHPSVEDESSEWPKKGRRSRD
jgi:uncharacterized membrane protein YdbT with pleckstrin-like domain